jgi:hypothetical protein
VDGSSSQWVVVEHQHGLLCCLGVAEGDEAIALHTHRSTDSTMHVYLHLFAFGLTSENVRAAPGDLQ